MKAGTKRHPKKAALSRVGSVREVKTHFSEYAKLARKAPVIVTNNGKPDLIVYSVRDADLEEVLLHTNPKFANIMKQVLVYRKDDLTDF